MPGLAVVIPATNRPATLDRCREALAAAGAGNGEVVVVDGPPGAGPAAARNRGAESRADADLVVFVDSDVAVHEDALRRIRAAFEADPGLDAVFGSYDDAPAVDGVVSSFRNLLHHHVHHQGAGPATTFWAGLGAVRRDAFAEAGGFDAERYPLPSVEDIELGMRMSAAGARIRLDPRIQGTHMKAWTLRDMLRTDFARRGVPWVALLLRGGGRGTSALNLGWSHRVSALSSVVVAGALLARRPVPAVAAAGVLVALNRPFYALLARRRGPAEAVAGVGLHVLHHLASVAAVPFGVLAHARERGRPAGA